MRVALAQLCSGQDPWVNLHLFENFIREAEEKKVDLLCFPENLFFRGARSFLGNSFQDFVFELDSKAQTLLLKNDFTRSLGKILAETSLYLSLGSVWQKSLDENKPYNTTLFFKEGLCFEFYRKQHLFEFYGKYSSYKESDRFSSGKEKKLFQINGHSFFASICFDLRFPSFYQNSFAEVILVPSAFDYYTGKAHWETLLRARAIENQAFVLAPAQWGAHLDSKGKEVYCYGRSLIVDPWGRILEEGPEQGDALLVCDLDFNELRQIRKRMPLKR